MQSRVQKMTHCSKVGTNTNEHKHKLVFVPTETRRSILSLAATSHHKRNTFFMKSITEWNTTTYTLRMTWATWYRCEGVMNQLNSIFFSVVWVQNGTGLVNFGLVALTTPTRAWSARFKAKQLRFPVTVELLPINRWTLIYSFILRTQTHSLK